eukprot:NODE_118_length_18285_cov_1.016606.p7 type:complete len:288 gc:universal NODE_118_length_18285_cov_1.016606:641-1504(+)
MTQGLLPFVFENLPHEKAIKATYNLGRKITDTLEENAFDHYEWSDTEIKDAQTIIDNKLKENNLLVNDSALSAEWCTFYEKNNRAFFKDRNWVLLEFPQLIPTKNEFRILDVGCGVGNTSIPIVEKVGKEFTYHIYACDYSNVAIQHFPVKDQITPFVHDALNPFPHSEMNAATLFFVMSAIRPENWINVFRNVYDALLPGGYLLFRDYGYYDLTQLRFKPKQCISDSLYQRSDGTLTYFAKIDWVAKLAREVGFSVKQCILDRRVIVNRKTKIKMKRVWIHACFQK